jgi:hypothetical protein
MYMTNVYRTMYVLRLFLVSETHVIKQEMSTHYLVYSSQSPSDIVSLMLQIN